MSVSEVRGALQAVKDKTTADSCLQYLLSGSATTLNFVDGFNPLHTEFYTCACDVVNSNTLSKDTKNIINKRSKIHDRKKT